MHFPSEELICPFLSSSGLPHLSHVEDVENPLHCASFPLRVDDLAPCPGPPDWVLLTAHKGSLLETCPGRRAPVIFTWKSLGGFCLPSGDSPQPGLPNNEAQGCPSAMLQRSPGDPVRLDHVSICPIHASLTHFQVSPASIPSQLLAQEASLGSASGQHNLRHLCATLILQAE